MPSEFHEAMPAYAAESVATDRAVIMDGGERGGGGGMVFLREDLGRFGEQVYRGSLL